MLTEEMITLSMKSFCQNTINILENIFQAITGKEVNICIKVFDINKPWENDINKMQVSTLCRSSKSMPERCEIDNKPVRVVDNTDFLTILKDGNPLFASSNLIKFEKNYSKINKIYLNSNPNWKNFYRSTIVVPIRIHTCYLPKSLNKRPSQDYHIMGFLCVDSMSTATFENDKTIMYYTEITYAVADLLYRYLERCSYYLRFLERSSSMR